MTAEPPHLIVSGVRVPGAMMQFTCRIEPTDSGSRITDQIRMSGPLASLYGLLMRGRNLRQLPQEMDQLERPLAPESQPSAARPWADEGTCTRAGPRTIRRCLTLASRRCTPALVP